MGAHLGQFLRGQTLQPDRPGDLEPALLFPILKQPTPQKCAFIQRGQASRSRFAPGQMCVYRAQDAQFGEHGQHGRRFWLRKDQVKFMPQARSADLRKEGQAGFQQAERARLNREAEAYGKPHGAQHAGGIVHKRQGMQYPDAVLLQVCKATPKVKQLAVVAAIQSERQGIDGEIAPMQIHFDAALFHGGQRSRLLVEFRAGGNQVQVVGQLGRVDLPFRRKSGGNFLFVLR